MWLNSQGDNAKILEEREIWKMVKKIRIIVGNSAYKDNSGFGYSRLEVDGIKNEDLSDIYYGIPEIAFIPRFDSKFSNEYYKYLEVLSFRRLLFLLLGEDFRKYNNILNGDSVKVAENFMNYNIYFVNYPKTNVEKLIENIIRKYNSDNNESYEIYILYVGNKAHKIKIGNKVKGLVEETKEYNIIHPAARGENLEKCLKSWVNFNYIVDSNTNDTVRDINIDNILEAFRIDLEEDENN